MSKTTLAVVAGISALSGAALSAAIYSTKGRKIPTPTSTPTPTQALPPTASRPSTETAVRFLKVNPPVDPSGVFQYGFPGPISDIHPTPSTTSALDRRTRNPHWVAEHITPESLSIREGDRRHSYFAEDGTVPEKFRAKLEDYHRSGYDRGHQVPAADAKWSQEAMDSTFFLTNMCPQVGDGFNRDYWAHFEDFCRRLTHHYPSVRIITGPLYLPRKDRDGKWRTSYEVIGNPPNVSVPTHFFKVIFAEDGRTGGNVSLGAFVLPNAPIANDKPLKDFEAPIEAVEKASGLDFASKLPTPRRKRLCAEIECSLTASIQAFMENQKKYQDRDRNRNKSQLTGQRS